MTPEKETKVFPIQNLWERQFNYGVKERTLGPKMVQWLCTHKCNFKCPHCGTDASEARPEELTTAQILKTVDGLGALGLEKFYMTGGEPIMRDDLFQVIDHAKKEYGMAVGFVTNGFAIEQFASQIEKSEVDSVLVSIDGFRENHDRIRGTPDAYRNCIKSLDILEDIGVPIRGASTVYMKENLDDVPKIIEEIFAHGCTRHRVQSIIPEGRAKDKVNSSEEIKQMLRTVIEARKQGYATEYDEATGFLGPLEGVVRPYDFFCGCGLNTFTIVADGKVQGCPLTDYPEINEGNVKNESIEDIWWEKFERFRGDNLYASLPQMCHDCEYLQACRGGCWLHRMNHDGFCRLKEAQEVAEEML